MDVNERAKEQWKAETDSFERVQATLERTTEPATAGEIAERALVAEKTARKHLGRLIDLGIAEEIQEGRTTKYKRDPETLVMRRIRELRSEHSRQELLDGIQQMRAEIADYRDEHGVDSPEELAVTLDPGDPDAAWLDLAEWRTTTKNLAIVQAALSLDQATDRVEA